MKVHKINTSSFFPARLAPLLLLLLLLVLTACERQTFSEKTSEKQRPEAKTSEQTRSIPTNLTETKLATVPEEYEAIASVTFSAEGRQVAYAARKGAKNFVVVGDTPSRPYDAVWKDTIALSRDGRRIAYSGKTQGKWYLVLDGKEGRPYENTGSISFTQDGRLVCYEAKEKGKWFISVIDGEKELYRSKAYRDSFRPPVFSPDGQVLVFELGERGKKRIVFVLDLSAQKMITELVYDEQGIAGRFSFSSDFSRIVHEADKGDKFILVFHDLVLQKERTIEIPDMKRGTIMLGPDGKKVVYMAERAGRRFLVVSPWEDPLHGNEKGPFDEITSPVFSTDAETVAFQALKERKWRTVVGDREGRAKYDAVDAPVFSPDGSSLAYPAMRNGRFFMVVSPAGRPAAIEEGPAYDMVVTPVFSPDGRRIAYRARKGSMENARRFIVIADAKTGKVLKEGRVGDEIWPPVWRPDGKAVGYGTRIGRELWWKVEVVQ